MIAALLLVATALLTPAFINGFPLIFPDSGTYLSIAFGPEYAIDRSSVYGLLLKPIIGLAPDIEGLWVAVSIQAMVVSALLLCSAATLLPGIEWRTRTAWLLPAIALTSLPWHAAQFMPDAFAGPLVLTTWLLVVRPVRANGSVLLWAASLMMAATHYTHPVILAATAFAALLGLAATGVGFAALVKRAIPPLLAAGSAVLILIGMNGMVLGQWRMSPLGSAFLFARLNEDGLIAPWLAKECRQANPSLICGERDRMPADSQKMLWGNGESVIERHIWGARTDKERWQWAQAFTDASREAILAMPGQFAINGISGGTRQFFSFRALDDECPANCGNPTSGIGRELLRYRPETYPALQNSAQRRGTTPKTIVRSLTTPIASLGLFLMPFVGWSAWRRRDRMVLTFICGVTGALLVNAVMTGGLSDVHDRYQSRLIWLVPLGLLLIGIRWRSTSCIVRQRDVARIEPAHI